MDIKDKIKKLVLKYPKEDLADKIGITRPTLNTRLEKGNWKKGEIAIIKQIAI